MNLLQYFVFYSIDIFIYFCTNTTVFFFLLFFLMPSVLVYSRRIHWYCFNLGWTELVLTVQFWFQSGQKGETTLLTEYCQGLPCRNVLHLMMAPRLACSIPDMTKAK